ncbi:unnamed protein product [Adineta steineri]|uniref:Uncharacterized protein n=1 Tax=Adineta steineri TaxID=433720 RepID=A0A818LAN7_9BILA|nr:unnamed protein product [Adineta steineri]CAF3569766.1 unnamed protein product [Adineta steineri]
MYYYSGVIWICMYSVLFAYGEQNLFDKKCKRECDTQYGTYDCWKTTIDGFTYGLSTSMINYCQVILQVRQKIDEKFSWYNVSRDLLTKQINEYNLDSKARQITKNDAKQIVTTLLNKCFYTSSSSISSIQPSCPSCSKQEIKLIKESRLFSLFSSVSCFVLIFVIILLYALHINSTRRSYQSIG